ncbi:MAG TPA: ABC transporter permease [Ruminococcaceae bacterium]|nr:ABC transporter permease [Oscillospiraceae bacterium]
MKSALRKNAVAEIFKTRSRFLSIFCIVAIGVAFFAGVKTAAPDMRSSADIYYKNGCLADYRLVSTFGFSDKDIEALEEVSGIEVYPGYFTDALIAGGNEEEIAHVMSLSEYGENNSFNKLELLDGRFPEAPNECIVDSGALIGGREIGDTLAFTAGKGEDISETLKISEYTVVGKFISPAYIDMSSKGNTTIGNGNINTLIYIPEENFKTEVYTEVYIASSELKALTAYSDEFDRKSAEIKAVLEEIGGRREIERYDEIIAEAEKKIADAQKELAEGKAEAEKELADGKKELEAAKAELDKAEKQLSDAKKQLDEGKEQSLQGRRDLDKGWEDYYKGEEEAREQFAKADKEILDNKQRLLEGETAYNEGLIKYNTGLSEYNRGLEEYNGNLALYEQGYRLYTALDEYYKRLHESEGRLPDIGGGFPSDLIPEIPPEIKELFEGFPSEEEVKAKLAELEEAKALLDDAKLQLDEAKKQLDEAEKELKAAKAELEEGKKQLTEGEISLANEKAKAEKQLAEAAKELAKGEAQYNEGLERLRQGEADYESGLKEFEQGRKDYEKGLAEYERGKTEADSKVEDGEKKIREAKRELKDLKNPSWYVFDRDDYIGNAEYGENADRINNIASVFPVFFILVAALVCLTTMTRMVEEQRSQIGTLKALGYTNGQIIFKFMFYALAATVSGSFMGAIVGEKLFPFVIIKAYGMMYSIPVVHIPTDWLLTLACMAVSAAAVTLTVYFSCKSELYEQPAQLMRPKAPRAGKKILLDRLPIWKKVGFNGKVTARNLFRYKRRMLMTVVGIAGCTALTLVGFALDNSISEIISKQYGELNSYSGILAYESVDSGDEEEIFSLLKSAGCKGVKYYQKKLSVKSEEGTYSAYLIVPENKEELLKFYTFRDRKTQQIYEFEEDRILIDEKLSILLGVKAGDSVQLYPDETNMKTAEISACVENYPNHYVYMSKSMYSRLFGEEPEYNIMAFGTEDGEQMDGDEQSRLAQKLLATNAVMSVKYKEEMVSTMNSMLNALNSVIGVLIVSAGALAFVVLYNLTNININERIREIATLKVMGFYDLEVDSYIFRENLILTLMGIAAGLFGGTFLSYFIIETAEIDMVMFGRDIMPFSYVISGIITLGFSIIVTLYMHRHLKKVDMIEALKSVE